MKIGDKVVVENNHEYINANNTPIGETATLHHLFRNSNDYDMAVIEFTGGRCLCVVSESLKPAPVEPELIKFEGTPADAYRAMLNGEVLYLDEYPNRMHFDGQTFWLNEYNTQPERIRFIEDTKNLYRIKPEQNPNEFTYTKEEFKDSQLAIPVPVEPEYTLVESIFDLNKDERYFTKNHKGCYVQLLTPNVFIGQIIHDKNLYRIKPKQNPNEFTYTGDVEALAKWMGHTEADVEWWVNDNDNITKGCKIFRITTTGDKVIFKVKK